MGTVQNKSNTPIGERDGIYPTHSIDGASLVTEDVDGTSVVVMLGLGLGVHNSGASDITLEIPLVRNDVTNTATVVVIAGTTWSGFFFNGVVVAGSTGHDSATTHYLYK